MENDNAQDQGPATAIVIWGPTTAKKININTNRAKIFFFSFFFFPSRKEDGLKVVFRKKPRIRVFNLLCGLLFSIFKSVAGFGEKKEGI